MAHRKCTCNAAANGLSGKLRQSRRKRREVGDPAEADGPKIPNATDGTDAIESGQSLLGPADEVVPLLS